ncbi:MAG: hypothetical protein KAU94_04285 [Verrucomicrobia bacterium]|nr:hypothetical protein [Verrucomicrobiota bacterium]
MRILFLVSVLIAFSTAVMADFRIWNDQKGNTIEAELASLSATHVVIRDRKGKIYKFSPAKLCSADQSYLRSIPPKIEINFKKTQDRRKHNYGYAAYVYMTGEVIVKKAEQRAYDGTLKVVLLMIGESQRHHDYVILDRAEESFNFKQSREISLVGKRFSMYEDKYDNNVGYKYKGYVAVVLDSNDKIVEVKASRNDFKEKCGIMLKFKAKTRFSTDFKKLTDSSKDATMHNGSFFY